MVVSKDTWVGDRILEQAIYFLADAFFLAADFLAGAFFLVGAFFLAGAAFLAAVFLATMMMSEYILDYASRKEINFTKLC